ncbi:MAG: DUF1847 domain-containing protein [Deltaproteobacteria bacterium]
MTQCARCGKHACLEATPLTIPGGCPMEGEGPLYEESLEEYKKPEIRNIALTAAIVEAMGYGVWTRLEEIVEFAWRAQFHRLGLAFCMGLSKEAARFEKILRNFGFEVKSAVCKTGRRPKELLGIKDEQKVRPGQFEVICNPIAQAKLLNKGKTDLNIVLGLCVGHDTLFFKYSQAPVTVLAVKDRVLAHNPLGAIYSEFYYSKKLAGHKKPR